MKLIADGGAITKNVTANTRDAIILGLNTYYVDGFKLQLYMTKDHQIISLSDETYQFFSKHIGKISEKTLPELLHYNVGTNVQKQQIITLKEILTIFQNYQKELVLELVDQGNKNALFTDVILTMIRPYAGLSIYLESKSLEIVSYLKSSLTNHPIGVIVSHDTRSNWYEDVDFYDIQLSLLNEFDIRKKIEKNKLVMLDEINRREVFDLVYQEYQDVFNSIFIITAFISIINTPQPRFF